MDHPQSPNGLAKPKSKPQPPPPELPKMDAEAFGELLASLLPHDPVCWLPLTSFWSTFGVKLHLSRPQDRLLVLLCRHLLYFYFYFVPAL